MYFHCNSAATKKVIFSETSALVVVSSYLQNRNPALMSPE